MGVGALVSAGAGVLLVSSYSGSISNRYGELRPVVVTTSRIARGLEISPSVAVRRLAVRQVPMRFAPASALSDPAEAIGFEPRIGLAGGLYLTVDLVRRPEIPGRRGPTGALGLVPVELSVSAPAGLGAGIRVDVLVGPSPNATGRGSTRTVARSARLLAIDPADPEAGPEPVMRRATIAVTRARAISLVDAETAGRRLTLLPGRLG